MDGEKEGGLLWLGVLWACSPSVVGEHKLGRKGKLGTKRPL